MKLNIVYMQKGANHSALEVKGVAPFWGYINLSLLAFIIIGTYVTYQRSKKQKLKKRTH